MKKHFAYLKYLTRHKWYVFLASRKIGAGLWQSIIHDWQKFLPWEWCGYVKTFYTTDGKKRAYDEKDIHLQYAWNHHQKHAKHHWQYWLLTWDGGNHEPLKIPEKYIREMVADWYGAGRAIKGRWEVLEWYKRSKDKMILNEESRKEIEQLLFDTIKKFPYEPIRSRTPKKEVDKLRVSRQTD